MSKVLIIGDTHLPAVHPGYRAFVRDIGNKYKCNVHLHIGDLADFAAISRHDSLPEQKSALDEYEEANETVKKWYKTFPDLIITEGNHDLRVVRQGAEVNIPERFLKGYNELWNTPKWTWVRDTTIDDVYYTHGMGCGGLYPAANLMRKMLCSVVIGHIHTAAGISWAANPVRRIFGMSVGCGVNDKHLAFAYARDVKARSILACGVVIDGVPYHHIMPMGKGERYHSSRF